MKKLFCVVTLAFASTCFAQDVGKWNVQTTEPSPIDDSVSTFATLDSENKIESALYKGKPYVMTVACKKGEIVFNITFKGTVFPMSLKSKEKATFRFDKEAAFENGVEIFKIENLMIGKDEKSANFLKQMRGHEKMAIAAKPSRGDDVVAIFDIRGVKDATQDIMKECGLE